jgi:hypothetical protein
MFPKQSTAVLAPKVLVNMLYPRCPERTSHRLEPYPCIYPSITSAAASMFPCCPPAGYRLGTLPIHHITVLPAGWVPAGYPTHPSHHRLAAGWSSRRLGMSPPPPIHHITVLPAGWVPAGYRLGTGWVPAGYPTHPSHHRLAAGWVPVG